MLTQRPVREGWNRLRGYIPLFEEKPHTTPPFQAEKIIATQRNEAVRVIGTLGFEIRTQDDLNSIRDWAMVAYPNATKLHLTQNVVARTALKVLDDSPRLLAEKWNTSGFWEFSLHS